MDNYPASPPRRHHRKRISGLRLSVDSITPLPVYSSPLPTSSDLPSDRPPDYPNSSEEADADESDLDQEFRDLEDSYVPPFHPRRGRRLPYSHTRHHRRTSSDIYLDSLLARSVHALEVSNTLLQSSMSSQSNLSAAISSEPLTDCPSETSSRGFPPSSKPKPTSLHDNWMDDFQEIANRMDSLLEDGEEYNVKVSPEDPNSVSQSLPITGLSPLVKRDFRRRPSLQAIQPHGHLDYSNHNRSHLISPAPRAHTVYIDSNINPNEIMLPSTLDSPSPSSHLIYSSSPESAAYSCKTCSNDTRVPEPSRRAYDILSSYVTPSPPMSHSKLSSPRSPSNCRSSSESRSGPSTPRMSRHLRSDSFSSSKSRGRSLTPSRIDPQIHLPRPMTPPIEELSSASDTSSSDTLRAVLSLRKILDDQAQVEQARLASNTPGPSSFRSRPPPALLSPTVSASIASTSHATASVSRLFTKNTHSSSTRPPSPPRHSLLRTSATPSPSPSHSLLSVSNLFSNGIDSNSGRLTPSRVKFAQLPESYARSKSGPSRQSNWRKDSKKRKGNARSGKDGGSDDNVTRSWWMAWLSAGEMTGGLREDRMEDKATRWGMRPSGPGVGGGLDEWNF